MTKRAEFHILKTSTVEASSDYVCDLISKVYDSGYPMFIYAQTQSQAELLDEKLWTYREDTFIPHALITEQGYEQSPIVIGNNLPQNIGKFNVLLNLSHPHQSQFESFPYILEMVMDSEESKNQSRENYRTYQAWGATIKTHQS